MSKLIALLLVLSTSSAALALSARDSWTKIFASGAVLEFEPKLGLIELNNACATKTDIRTIRPIRSCLKTAEVFEVFDQSVVTTIVCEKWGHKYISLPRVSKRLICLEDGSYPSASANKGCLEYGEEFVRIEDRILVNVRDPGDVWPAFVKPFTFPACR